MAIPISVYAAPRMFAAWLLATGAAFVLLLGDAFLLRTRAF